MQESQGFLTRYFPQSSLFMLESGHEHCCRQASITPLQVEFAEWSFVQWVWKDSFIVPQTHFLQARFTLQQLHDNFISQMTASYFKTKSGNIHFQGKRLVIYSFVKFAQSFAGFFYGGDILQIRLFKSLCFRKEIMERDINLLPVRIYDQLKHSKLSSSFPHFLHFLRCRPRLQETPAV